LGEGPESHSDGELVPYHGDEEEDDKCNTNGFPLYSFSIQIQKSDIGSDDKKTEELKVEVHGKTNESIL
jgi:hypothetical protein